MDTLITKEKINVIQNDIINKMIFEFQKCCEEHSIESDSSIEEDIEDILKPCLDNFLSELVEKENESIQHLEKKMKTAKVYIPITAFQEIEVEVDDNATEEDVKKKVLSGEFSTTGGLDKVKQDMDSNNWEVELN